MIQWIMQRLGWRRSAKAVLPAEFARFTSCPYCHDTEFADGSRGGVAVNVTCVGCGARFNVAEVGDKRFFIQELSGPARPLRVVGLRRN